MTTDLVEEALRRARTLRPSAPGRVVMHSDRGAQFTAEQMYKCCQELKVDQSMGRTGVSLLTGYSTRGPWRRHVDTHHVRRVFDARVQHVSHDGQGRPAARAA